MLRELWPEFSPAFLRRCHDRTRIREQFKGEPQRKKPGAKWKIRLQQERTTVCDLQTAAVFCLISPQHCFPLPTKDSLSTRTTMNITTASVRRYMNGENHRAVSTSAKPSALAMKVTCSFCGERYVGWMSL